MAYKRRRRPRVTWFPQLGIATSSSGTPNTITGIGGSIAAQPNSDVETVQIQPLTFDAPVETNSPDVGASVPLSYFIGNEYFLRRVVGKFYCCRSVDYNGELAGPDVVHIAMGLFVARAGSELESGGSDFPIDGATAAGRTANYNPLSPDQTREPWIWRRQWLLGSGVLQGAYLSQQTGFGPGINFPSSNVGGYGSVLDGPHCDAKTRRRVSSDDRLWCAVAVASPTLWSNGAGGGTADVKYYFDYRILGSLRKAHNRGNF